MFIFALVLLVASIVLGIIGKKIVKTKKVFQSIGIGLLVLSLFLAIGSFIRIVPAGQVGVINVFGNVNLQQRQPGLNIINPFAKLVIMDIQTQEKKESLSVPSKEGLSMLLDISILYRLTPDKASTIYKTIGSDYDDVVITPQFHSAVREATVFYEAKALYTASREELTNKIFSDLNTMLAERGIILEKVLLRAVKLPDTVQQAIDAKLKAEQESEQMKFVLTKESQEAERKIIEAKGIAEAQSIINKTLTSQYLQHEAIRAQTLMANSPNHTTVYIPSGDNGIPLVRVLENNQK